MVHKTIKKFRMEKGTIYSITNYVPFKIDFIAFVIHQNTISEEGHFLSTKKFILSHVPKNDTNRNYFYTKN